MAIFTPAQVTQYIGAPTTVATTTYGPAFAVSNPWDSQTILAQIPSLAKGALNVYVQESWDGGTTWADVAAFTQVAAGGATQQTRQIIGRVTNSDTARAVGIGTAASAPPALTAGSFASGPWGFNLRLVSVTGASASAAGVTATFFFTPAQSH